jgi:hypothetical protein
MNVAFEVSVELFRTHFEDLVYESRFSRARSDELLEVGLL